MSADQLFNSLFGKSSILEKGFFCNDQVEFNLQIHRYHFLDKRMEETSESDFITKLTDKKYKSLIKNVSQIY